MIGIAILIIGLAALLIFIAMLNVGHDADKINERIHINEILYTLAHDEIDDETKLELRRKAKMIIDARNEVSG